MDEDRPGEQETYRATNAELFRADGFGPAGKARDEAVDHPLVATLPQR